MKAQVLATLDQNGTHGELLGDHISKVYEITRGIKIKKNEEITNIDIKIFSIITK